MKDTKTVLPNVNDNEENKIACHSTKQRNFDMKRENEQQTLGNTTTTTTTSTSKTNFENEELIGGCCVCSDDQGFANNALVYCDGKGCTVACHTGSITLKHWHVQCSDISCILACYGIVSIPDGDWLCGRCEADDIRAVD
jgi:hypothetical protein